MHNVEQWFLKTCRVYSILKVCLFLNIVHKRVDQLTTNVHIISALEIHLGSRQLPRVWPRQTVFI